MKKTKKPTPAAPTATPQAITPPEAINPAALYRLSKVLQWIPVSPSAWWAGVKSGRYCQPVRLGPGTTCWRGSDLLALIEGAGHE